MEKYECLQQHLYREDIGEYFSYGISLEGRGLLVSDVSPDKEMVLHMVELMNTYELSPVHTFDVAEDFLAAAI